jgi:hypothetical protein
MISRPGAGSASSARLAGWASASVVARTCFARPSWRADLRAFLRAATPPRSAHEQSIGQRLSTDRHLNSAQSVVVNHLL